MSSNILLPFAAPLIEARFLRRRQRFLVDIEIDGRPLTAHSNNSGSMLGLLGPGGRVWLSTSDNPNRRLAHTLELVEAAGIVVGVNTLTPNRLLAALARQGRIAEFFPDAAGYETFQPEAKSPLCPPKKLPGAEPLARLDCMLRGPRGELWIEAKNVTLVEDGGVAAFPDAVTERGQKHLRELMKLAALPNTRAAVFFLVQRSDGACFAPADYVDPVYADLFYEAMGKGVEMWAFRAAATPAGIGLDARLEVVRRA